MSWPYTHVDRNSIKIQCFRNHGLLKGKSSLIIFDIHADLKYRYGNRNFWCRGYFVDIAGKKVKKKQEYIRNQLKEDYTADQISIKEYVDPFSGKKTK